MNLTTRDPDYYDYYDLAREDYESTRVALRQVPPVMSPATLSPERFRKFVRGEPGVCISTDRATGVDESRISHLGLSIADSFSPSTAP